MSLAFIKRVFCDERLSNLRKLLRAARDTAYNVAGHRQLHLVPTFYWGTGHFEVGHWGVGPGMDAMAPRLPGEQRHHQLLEWGESVELAVARRNYRPTLQASR